MDVGLFNNTFQDKEPDKCNFFDRVCLSDWRWSFCPFQHLKPDTSVIFFKKISFVLLIENIFFKFICKSSLSIPFRLNILLDRNNHAENTTLGIFEIRQSRFWVVYYKSVSYNVPTMTFSYISNPRYYNIRMILQRTSKFKRA